jgi:hypothetical protein
MMRCSKWNLMTNGRYSIFLTPLAICHCRLISTVLTKRLTASFTRRSIARSRGSCGADRRSAFR